MTAYAWAPGVRGVTYEQNEARDTRALDAAVNEAILASGDTTPEYLRTHTRKEERC